MNHPLVAVHAMTVRAFARADAGGTAGARAGLALPGNVIQPDFTG